ncbi:hypothetical protein F5146DRAFT_999187 [Armillaria mellea]|nr:hypothetical protein F5146DRAFT_999187 [Armillaria mellea]
MPLEIQRQILSYFGWHDKHSHRHSCRFVDHGNGVLRLWRIIGTIEEKQRRGPICASGLPTQRRTWIVAIITPNRAVLQRETRRQLQCRMNGPMGPPEWYRTGVFKALSFCLKWRQREGKKRRPKHCTYAEFTDATGAPHVTFEENPILINESGHNTLNRSGGPGALHASGNTAFLEEAKWHVIKTRATPLPELIVMGPSSAPWPSSKHHAPGHTVCFNSESPEDLAIPSPINPMPDVGTVYIHRQQNVDSSVQPPPSRCASGPQYCDRYFQLSKDMKPSWVTDATKIWYEKEEEKKAIRLQPISILAEIGIIHRLSFDLLLDVSHGVVPVVNSKNLDKRSYR